MKLAKLKFQKLEKNLKMSPGLKKVLGTKNNNMNRMEIFSRLIERIYFLKLHHFITSKNFHLPLSWKRSLKWDRDFVDELDLFKIITNNTK